MTKFLTICCLVLVMTGFAQERGPRHQSAGVATGMVVSANGYGGRNALGIYYRHGRVVSYAGILAQKQRYITGAEFRIDYALTGVNTPDYVESDSCPKNLELFTFFNTAYNNNACLSQRTLTREEQASADMKTKPLEHSFQSVEAYAGFGLKWRIFKRVKWTNSIGLGGYYTLNYPGAMYYEKCSAGLVMRTEFSFRLWPN